MSLNTKPLKKVAYAALGLPVIWVARSTSGTWPQTGVTMAFDGESGIISFAPTSFSVDGMDALWNLTAEQIATLDGITSWRIQINGAWPLMAGFLSWGSGWKGTDECQSLGAVVVGPPGPTAVSADAGNAAVLGSDGLVFVAPGAVDPSILGVEWVQATPLATWTIPHSLGRRPAVALYIGGESVEADVAATSTTVVITLPSPMAGTAVLT